MPLTLSPIRSRASHREGCRGQPALDVWEGCGNAPTCPGYWDSCPCAERGREAVSLLIITRMLRGEQNLREPVWGPPGLLMAHCRSFVVLASHSSCPLSQPMNLNSREVVAGSACHLPGRVAGTGIISWSFS